MISLADVRDWLRGLGAVDATWTIGRYEAAKERRCCVYSRAGYERPAIAIGGRETTVTHVKGVNVVVHWNQNHRETEAAAAALYDALAYNPAARIGDDTASYIDLQLPEPVDLGSDENGIFERGILLDIYYEEGTRNA